MPIFITLPISERFPKSIYDRFFILPIRVRCPKSILAEDDIGNNTSENVP